MKALLKHPSAWIPFALTAAILGVFGLYFAGIIPPDPAGDDGTGAHVFQIWLVLEPLAILYFCAVWAATKPRETLTIVLLQLALAFVPLALVFSLHL